jgi:endoglucanase Acf2
MASANNRAKDFARKYQLSPKDMSALFSISHALASRWVSDTEEVTLASYYVNAIDTLDTLFEVLNQADTLRDRLCPAKLQVYEEWRDRD